MSPIDHDDPSARVPSRETVAIVTGGDFGIGREVARGLAAWGWAIVLVYLEHQPTAETTVNEILDAEGRIVAVRADLADDLDVRRLFAESTAAFAGVDVVVHTTTDSAALLYQHAAQHVRPRGTIVSVGSLSPEQVLASLGRWRRQAIG
jgi:short-subunit dehydrogenase involved in D-alanine esterification of teichoic acids